MRQTRYDIPETRRRRRWLLAYLLLLLGSAPIALPIWTAVLRDRIGVWLSVEAIHVLQYVGLGALVAWSHRGARRSRAHTRRLAGLVMGIGVLDEVIQQWLPNRFFQWSDVGWNWVGGLLGLAMSSGWPTRGDTHRRQSAV